MQEEPRRPGWLSVSPVAPTVAALGGSPGTIRTRVLGGAMSKLDDLQTQASQVSDDIDSPTGLIAQLQSENDTAVQEAVAWGQRGWCADPRRSW